jgi:hypothetical protein
MAHLGLAAGSIIVSNWMRMTGNTDVILRDRRPGTGL